MNKAALFLAAVSGALLLCGASSTNKAVSKVGNSPVLTGQDAFTDYTKEKPGVFRKITAADLPAPYATKAVGNGPTIVPRPE